jgi:hypothetical protein
MGERGSSTHHAARGPAHVRLDAHGGYTIKEIIVFMGHADLTTVQRYSYLESPL